MAVRPIRNPKDVGSDHGLVSKPVALPQSWQMKVSLYWYPSVVGSITVLLIALFWTIGKNYIKL